MTMTNIPSIADIEEGEKIEGVKGYVGYVGDRKTGKKGKKVWSVQNITLEVVKGDRDGANVRIGFWDMEEFEKSWKGKQMWVLAGDDGKLVVKDWDKDGEIIKQLSATNCTVQAGDPVGSKRTQAPEPEPSDNDGGEPGGQDTRGNRGEPDRVDPKSQQARNQAMQETRKPDPENAEQTEALALRNARIRSAKLANAFLMGFDASYFVASAVQEKHGLEMSVEEVQHIATSVVVHLEKNGMIAFLPQKPIYGSPTKKVEAE